MKVLKDLGMTDLDGKLSTKRRFYQVQCELCGEESTLRADSPKIKKHCTLCNKKQRIEENNKKALEVLNKGEKSCSVCKEVKPLEAFGHKSQMLTGFRSCCKDCRYEAEKATNADYIKSVKGKLVSAHRQSKRREKIYQTSNSSINTDFLEALKKKQNHQCYHCKTVLLYNEPYEVHLDHLIPLSKGGLHTKDNVVWSCRSCNLLKSNI